LKYELIYQRQDSMSVSEAVEYVKKKTSKRQDTCARKFAEALMNMAPNLTFWQNVPPDLEDLTSAQLIEVTEFIRQAFSGRHDTDARIIGPWIYDVYAGSKKKERFGNQWNDPYPFFYKDKVGAARLPLPLMKDFRASKKLMLAICNAAVGELIPRKPKGKHRRTAFVNQAATQVALAMRAKTDRHLSQRIIEDSLRKFDDNIEGWSRPIHEIVFMHAADTKSNLGEQFRFDVIVVTWASKNYETASKVVSLDVFARKVRERLD